MNIPWFMHCHRGRNTLVGVFPTPCGSFMRSWVDGRGEVAWYPLDHRFEAGSHRAVEPICSFGPDEEHLVDAAVADFMHAHPVLCTTQIGTIPDAPVINWQATSADRVQTVTAQGGAFIRTLERVNGRESAVVEYQPLSGRRVEVCRIATACGPELVERRIAARVARFDATAITKAA